MMSVLLTAIYGDWTHDRGQAGSCGAREETASRGRFVSTPTERSEQINSPSPEADPGVFDGELLETLW